MATAIERAFVITLFSIFAQTGSAKPPSEVPINMLVNPSGISTAALSPDGEHLAIIKFNGHRQQLIVGDVATFKFHTIASKAMDLESILANVFPDLKLGPDPQDVIWIGNDILGVNYPDDARSFDLDGTQLKYLGKRILGQISADAESAYVLASTNLESGDLARVDARTGATVPFRFNISGKAIKFALDKSGRPRAVTMINSSFWKDATTISNWYKTSHSQYWEKLNEFGIEDDYWTPLFVPDDDKTLLVFARAGTDFQGVYRYDIKTRTIVEKVLGFPGADVLTVDGIDKESLSRVWTKGMLPRQIWFDPTWDKLQKLVDEALPGRINVLAGNPTKRIVVHSYGDVDPGTWYLMEVPTLKLSSFGKTREAVQVNAMQPMKSISYQARDGLAIPAFLTLPKGAGKHLPTVIMIHGGPTVRDSWSWNKDVQFLVSRGYAVLQPQFRGSNGFGRSFQTAGYAQWGLSMQDDITDGVHYLVQQGIADPKRICIFGSSYGGYAALWGLAKTPELYRCGISFAGVTDLEMMLTGTSDSNSDKLAKELMRSRIGDIRVSKQKFDQVSPLKNVKDIKAPVLLMHGELDQRVPVLQGERMHKALVQEEKTVKWITFEDAGHGLYYLKDERLYFEAIGEFLEKYLAPDSSP
ncbi:putative dipeptidyl aminopeptidases/acylaminoacyl-peptidase family protein [Janthinobacterium sp. HH01]|uniref:alpha/beta hydrolase family protein n=1 Tax=Janthinobacterium sp. HH01 TaxID=1198452 RepID=UPI0002AE83BE|nr:alpha/beta fold hydrolase [Janthinobacterium sp. HH01]ELX13665.1 putative dipeptidyl aminopeptidases/acylaminoacyl-peptidase family protein [Janthinobacterium sp. HH01]